MRPDADLWFVSSAYPRSMHTEGRPASPHRCCRKSCGRNCVPIADAAMMVAVCSSFRSSGWQSWAWFQLSVESRRWRVDTELGFFVFGRLSASTSGDVDSNHLGIGRKHLCALPRASTRKLLPFRRGCRAYRRRSRGPARSGRHRGRVLRPSGAVRSTIFEVLINDSSHIEIKIAGKIALSGLRG
mgnify:CR=1 FL=1